MSRAAATLALLCFSSSAWAQQYQVSVEESGALPGVYEKRNNWRYYGDYRHTTMVASSQNPLSCQESPCLDDGEPGDKPPDSTRGGTASAQVAGMAPGKYRLELRYNQTVNRSTSVPWKIDSDAAGTNALSGKLDQKNTAPGSGNWLVLGGTAQAPLDVQSSVSFVFGSATVTFNGSLSYGGIRLIKTGELGPPSDGGADAGGAGGADAGGAGGAGGGSGAGGAGGSGGTGGGATDDAGSPDAASGGTIPLEETDAGCACRLGSKRNSACPPGLLLLAAIGVIGAASRRINRPA